MEAHLSAAIWFVNKDGTIIASAQSDSYPAAPYQIENFNPAEMGSAQYSIGDYHGYFSDNVFSLRK